MTSAEFQVLANGVRAKWPAAVGIVGFLVGSAIAATLAYAQVRQQIDDKASNEDVARIARTLCVMMTPAQRAVSQLVDGVRCSTQP